MPARLWGALLLAAGIALAAYLAQRRADTRAEAGDIERFQGVSMASPWSAQVVSDAPLSTAEYAALGEELQATLDEVDALMSTYKPDSEVSRLNAHRSTAPFPLSPATLAVLDIVRQVSALSGGAFDVTIGPVVAAWGFGAGAAEGPPSPEALAELMAHVGASKLSLDAAAGTATKQDPALGVDLSAIAQGFAADQAAAMLEEAGFSRFLVEVSGEIRARGRKPDGAAWQVGIERPDTEGGVTYTTIALEDAALATSGDYRKYYERDGVRISHTLDARTGQPITHALASVTVIHPQAAWADALATAINALGPEEGYDLADREGLPVLLLVRKAPGVFVERSTPAFARYRLPASPEASP